MSDPIVKIREEYRKMLKRWEDGDFYYHFKAFIKNYAKTGWPRYGSIKEAVCAVLTLSRMGLPITTPLMAALLNSEKELRRAEFDAREKLFYLASYGIIEPAEIAKTSGGWFARRFKVTKAFLEAMYLPLQREVAEEAVGELSAEGTAGSGAP